MAYDADGNMTAMAYDIKPEPVPLGEDKTAHDSAFGFFDDNSL